MESYIVNSLIGAFAVLLGALIGIMGQIIANHLNHRNQIKYLKKKIYFEKKINYSESVLETLDNKAKKLADFYNILTKIPYKERKSIQNLFSTSLLNEESQIYSNTANLYFKDCCFSKELMGYLELEKDFQDNVKNLAVVQREDLFNLEIRKLRDVLESIISKNQEIAKTFKNELDSN